MHPRISSYRLRNYVKRFRKPWVLVALVVLVLAGVAIFVSLSDQHGSMRTWIGQRLSNPGSSSADDPEMAGAEQTGRASESDGGTSQGNSEPATSPSPTTNLPPNYASGTYQYVSPDDPTPKNCTLEQGSVCTFLWRGIYQLTDFELAKLQVAAFENDRPEPISTAEVTIKQGLWRWFNRLTYTVSSDAEYVRFVVLVIAPNGSVLYRSDPPPPAIPIPH